MMTIDKEIHIEEVLWNGEHERDKWKLKLMIFQLEDEQIEDIIKPVKEGSKKGYELREDIG